MAISQIFWLNCGVPSMHFCQFLFCFATKDSVLFFCDHLLRVGLNYPLKWPSKGAQRLVKVAISTGCMFDFTVAMTFTLYSHSLAKPKYRVTEIKVELSNQISFFLLATTYFPFRFYSILVFYLSFICIIKLSYKKVQTNSVLFGICSTSNRKLNCCHS